MSGFIYLASPYTHPDPAVRARRYLAACRAARRPAVRRLVETEKDYAGDTNYI